jgi:asparagine synthase (glutamine-hydrolysing)
MSAIAGVIDSQNRDKHLSQTLDRMLACMNHRGRAGQNVYHQNGTAVGVRYTHKPVKPEDEQPFSDPHGNFWSVLEGRLFNYSKIRSDLEKRDIRFLGNSDAELIMYLYQLYGVDCLQQLEGEFAFAIWDQRKKRLFAARDRLGVHHLVYTLHNGTIYFASESKAILASEQIERRLDLKALDQVMFMNCTVAPRTMFEGISALPAGYYLLIQDNHIKSRAYWDLDYGFTKPAPHNEEEYRQQLLSLLRKAVKDRIPSDRKVGVYVSGGLDSSSVAALMSENGLGKIPAFFADFAIPAFSERKYADLISEALDLPLNVVEMSYQKVGENFQNLIWHGEAPLVLSEASSLLQLAKLAAKDVDVVLNGEGGDELLAGYVFNDWDRAYRKLQRFPLSLTLPIIRSLLPKFGFPRAFVLSKEEQAPAMEHLGCFPAPLYYNYAVREVIAFYSGDLRAKLQQYSPIADIAQVLNTQLMSQWDPLSQSLYFSTKINLPNYLLGPHGDRSAASAGLEAFFPFLDHRLMEFAAQVPNGLKVKKGEEKYLLKSAMIEILPKEIVQRRKSPMTSPTSPAFLGAEAPEYVQELLSPQSIDSKGYFDSELVTQMVEDLKGRDLTKDRNNRMDVMLSFPLVGVLSVQIFDEIYIKNFSSEPPT